MRRKRNIALLEAQSFEMESSPLSV